MKTTIGNSIRGLLLIPLLFVCFGLLPAARAVTPAPDGGYPGFNTAEGQFSLLNLDTSTGLGNTALGFAALKFASSGDNNTAVGVNALLFNTTAIQNTGVGQGALLHNNANGQTAVGFQALGGNTSGNENTAVGFRALSSNVANGFSVAVGFQALDLATGGQNTAVGDNALGDVTTGALNTAIGDVSGFTASTGNNNVYIGAFQGASSTSESNTTRISNILNTFQPFSAGVVGFVTVGPNNKLGNGSFSSQRYKDDIKPMDKASETIYALKPVAFRYKQEFEPTHSQQYGLIAEDVVKVDPNLVIYDEDGKVRSVRYDLISNMLLNEFLKAHKKVEEQQASIADLKSTVALQKKEMQVLTAQLKEQAAQIQKVSAQIRMTKPAPKVVVNTP